MDDGHQASQIVGKRRSSNKPNAKIDFAYTTELKEMDNGGVFFFLAASQQRVLSIVDFWVVSFPWLFGVPLLENHSVFGFAVFFPFHILPNVTTPNCLLFWLSFTHCVLA